MYTYEWDERKRLANLAKHKLNFLDASVVFDDPFAIELFDERRDYGEDRLVIIGMFKTLVVALVIYTEEGQVRRIISFRRATKKEEAIYNGNR